MPLIYSFALLTALGKANFMNNVASSLKKADYYLIISFITLFTPLILFVFRRFDDNRLTSWQWVFADQNLAVLFPFLLAGIFTAYLFSRTSFYEHQPLFLFISSFICATIFWQEPEAIVDAARYFTQAKHLKMYGTGYFFGEWGKAILVWTDLPLVPFLYGIIFKFMGESRIYIQMFTTLLFSLTTVLTYHIGKTLWNETNGFYAGLLLLGIPYLFSQIPLMLVDIPVMFFLMLSIFTVVRALERGGNIAIIIASLSLFLTFFSKYSAWLLLSVFFIIGIVYFIRDPKATMRRSSAIILIWLFLVGIVVMLKYDVISDQIRLLLIYQKPGLKRWGESFTSTFLFQMHPFITLSAVYSVFVAIKKKDLKHAIISYLVILFLMLQIKRIRYTLPLFPMITLMASYGLSDVRNKELRKFVIFCIITSSLVLSFSGYLPFLKKISAVNLKEAGQYLNSLEISDVEVITLPQKKSIINPSISVPLLDLYTNKRIIYSMVHDQSLVWEEVKESPLRFTWRHRNPEYYLKIHDDSRKAEALVVIASEQNQKIPAVIEQRTREYANAQVFDASTGIFRYKTFVTVHH